MANALIGKLNADGSITGIYCHLHGAPGETGKNLTVQYSQEKAIDELFAQGHTPSLQVDSALAMQSHNNWCGDNWKECKAGKAALSFGSLESFMEVAHDKCMFAYLFRDNNWQYVSLERRRPVFKKLTAIDTTGLQEYVENKKTFRLKRNDNFSAKTT